MYVWSLFIHSPHSFTHSFAYPEQMFEYLLYTQHVPRGLFSEGNDRTVHICVGGIELGRHHKPTVTGELTDSNLCRNSEKPVSSVLSSHKKRRKDDSLGKVSFQYIYNLPEVSGCAVHIN